MVPSSGEALCSPILIYHNLVIGGRVVSLVRPRLSGLLATIRAKLLTLTSPREVKPIDQMTLEKLIDGSWHW